MAKRFFYVCAGLFLLALSYHFGAKSATAQAVGLPTGSFFGPGATAIVGSTLYSVQLNTYTGIDAPPTSIELPRAGNVLDARADAGSGAIGETWVMYDDGAIYEYLPTTGWHHVVNLFSQTPTPAQGATWGELKARYRK